MKEVSMKWNKRITGAFQFGILLPVMLLVALATAAQDATELVKKVKAKMDKVNDYSATGRLRTDVAFLKVPVARVQVFYRKPNRFRITKEKGISILPKGGVSINMQHVLAEKEFAAIDGGTVSMYGQNLRMVKVLPTDPASDIVLTTLYIDDKQMLVRKASTTTRENGTYDVELFYGKFAEYGLPDKTLFSFNTKDYKLPKGVTMEFDDGERPDAAKLKNKKGFVELTYESYTINKGVPDSYFTGK